MKYVAFFDTENHGEEQRSVNAAAAAVISYMIEAMASVEPVKVYSPARSLCRSGCYRGRKEKIAENAVLYLPPSVGVHTPIGRAIMVIYTQLWLFFKLFFQTKRGEKVVFYHSISTMKTVSALVWLKKIKPVLEFREIYSDIDPIGKRLTKTEHTYYHKAVGFIFPSRALKDNLKVAQPCLYVPGSYRLPEIKPMDFHDGQIHAVYAGNLRFDKGGAFLAVDCARYLPSNYTVHILGSGTQEEINRLNEAIASASTDGGAKLSFDGFRSGEALTSFLSGCRVGLAIQKTAKYSNTSFPSKILTYLGCGMTVVAPAIDAVTTSAVAEYVQTYDGDEPESIARAIIAASEAAVDGRNLLQESDRRLRQDLVSFLK